LRAPVSRAITSAARSSALAIGNEIRFDSIPGEYHRFNPDATQNQLMTVDSVPRILPAKFEAFDVIGLSFRFMQ
jgi:hypothetical protein